MPDTKRTMEGRRVRRTDPLRRDRIIDACLDVNAESGVAGATHRKIAAAADVPLGSMTYHFDSMGELLRDAFTKFTDLVAEAFEHHMQDARNPEEATTAVVALITEDVSGNQRDLVLSFELYTLAVRDPHFRGITNAWMARSRKALECHFPPITARQLGALIEGLTVHRALDDAIHDHATALDAIERITR